MATGSDMAWLFAIVIFFIGSATLLPYTSESNRNADLDSSLATNSLCENGLNDISTCSSNSMSSLNTSSWYDNIVEIFKTLFRIVSMFFWSFGAIPWYLDLFIYIPVRIVFIVLILRMMPSTEISIAGFSFKIGGSG